MYCKHVIVYINQHSYTPGYTQKIFVLCVSEILQQFNLYGLIQSWCLISLQIRASGYILLIIMLLTLTDNCSHAWFSGACYLAAITLAAMLVPRHSFKCQKRIWRSGTDEKIRRVSDLQTSCSNLFQGQDTRIVGLEIVPSLTDFKKWWLYSLMSFLINALHTHLSYRTNRSNVKQTINEDLLIAWHAGEEYDLSLLGQNVS